MWDFIVKLPKSQEPLMGAWYNSILVGLYRLTKYAYFLLHMESAMVEDIVYIFMRTIVANYRLLDEVILDRDKLFTSHF